MLKKIFFLLVLILMSQQALAETFIVNVLDDKNDGDCSDEHCSLREAVTLATKTENASIEFDVQNGCDANDVCIIELEKTLVINAPMTIDGYTQAAASPNTNLFPEELNTEIKMVHS